MSKKGITYSQGSGVTGTEVISEDVALTVLEAEFEVLEGPFDEAMSGLSDAIGRALGSGGIEGRAEKALALAEERLDKAARAVERVRKEVFAADS